MRSILCRKYAVAFDGTDQPHYKTSFMEGGVCKTEWLEAGELPVMKLADFEVALDEEEEEEAEIRAAKRPRTTRSRGPAPPPADLPLSDNMDEDDDDDNDDSEEDSEDDDDRTSSPMETKSRGSVPSESDMTYIFTLLRVTLLIRRTNPNPSQWEHLLGPEPASFTIYTSKNICCAKSLFSKKSTPEYCCALTTCTSIKSKNKWAAVLVFR